MQSVLGALVDRHGIYVEIIPIVTEKMASPNLGGAFMLCIRRGESFSSKANGHLTFASVIKLGHSMLRMIRGGLVNRFGIYVETITVDSRTWKATLAKSSEIIRMTQNVISWHCVWVTLG